MILINNVLDFNVFRLYLAFLIQKIVGYL